MDASSDLINVSTLLNTATHDTESNKPFLYIEGTPATRKAVEIIAPKNYSKPINQNMAK